MTKIERVLIAGAGSVAPLAISFITCDIDTVFKNLTLLVCIGYLLRVVVLFSLGAMVGLINTRVTDRKVVFQLGITAPAIVGSLITISSLENKQQVEPKVVIQSTSSFSQPAPIAPHKSETTQPSIVASSLTWSLPNTIDSKEVDDLFANDAVGSTTEYRNLEGLICYNHKVKVPFTYDPTSGSDSETGLYRVTDFPSIPPATPWPVRKKSLHLTTPISYVTNDASTTASVKTNDVKVSTKSGWKQLIMGFTGSED